MASQHPYRLSTAFANRVICSKIGGKERLAKFKVPRSVEFLPALPKGGPGKILKKVLREKYGAGYAKRVH